MGKEDLENWIITLFLVHVSSVLSYTETMMIDAKVEIMESGVAPLFIELSYAHHKSPKTAARIIDLLVTALKDGLAKIYKIDPKEMVGPFMSGHREWIGFRLDGIYTKAELRTLLRVAGETL